MAHSPRDVETEIVDLTDLSLSTMGSIGQRRLHQAVMRILAADADPAEPLFGGDPPSSRPPDEQQ